MSTIRCIYNSGEPSFPATDQHPDAVRYFVSGHYVDAIGGEPTPAEVSAVLNPPAIDLSNIDNLEKTLKALALLMRDYCNALQAGTYTQKSVAQLKSDFAAKYASLP